MFEFLTGQAIDLEMLNNLNAAGCPACGGKIIKGRRGYGCSNWKAQDGGCRFVIWEMISGTPIQA